MNCYEPEGRKIAGTANQRYCGSLEGLREAMAEGVILEGWGARISGARPDLLVDLGGIQGVIPHDEGALGMEDGSTRDIALLTRVGKPVCFVVTGFEELADGTLRPVLSRRQAQQRCQEEYLDTLVPGDIISARVTHLEPFGCFVDIGCGIASLLPIDAISVSRIAHPSDRFRVGEEIRVVVRGRAAKLTGGKLKRASTMDSGVTLNILYILIEVNGESVVELDKMNLTYKVNGVDLLAEYKEMC